MGYGDARYLLPWEGVNRGPRVWGCMILERILLHIASCVPRIWRISLYMICALVVYPIERTMEAK